MEHENEIRSLSAETLAMNIVLANMFSRFARIPALRLAIVVGFDQSVDMAEDITSVFGKSAPPDHMVKISASLKKCERWCSAMGESQRTSFSWPLSLCLS